MEAVKSEPDILVLGASRAGHHYNTQMMENELHKSVYNIGLDGTNTFVLSRVLRIFLANHKPDAVIVDLSYGMSFELRESLSGKLKSFYLTEKYLDNFPSEISDFKFTEKFFKHINFYKYNSIFAYLLRDYFIPPNKKMIKGYQPLSGVDKLLTEPDSLKMDVNVYDQELYDSVVDMVRVCQENNVKIVCVSSPRFYSNTNLVPQDFREFMKEHKVPYLNYGNKEYKIFSKPEYFKDTSHLNSTGADIFTEMFIKDIQEIIHIK